MAPNDTARLPHRLLLNAEPFGFGPTAAIASFFPYLRDAFASVGYVGKKHTLDLQRNLPYDAIHDMTNVPKPERGDMLRPVMEGYDILLTAMDHKVAEIAKEAGLKVIYYDALAWYWPSFPASVTNSDVYIAQNFFGVDTRLNDVFAHHAAAHIVPPIAPAPRAPQPREHVLINLGGLQNPFWPVAEVVEYARTMIPILRRAVPANTKIIIAGPEAVANAMADYGVTTYPRAQMEDVLARTHVAFMTPGLGNIYDAAAFNVPTIWLPPANDSQGQQLKIMEVHDMIDAALDWAPVLGNAGIDYSRDQPSVLAAIAQTATRLAREPQLQARLCDIATDHFYTISRKRDSKSVAITQRFGCGGERAVADIVIKAAQGIKAARMHYA